MGTKRDETGPLGSPAASRCDFPKQRRQKLGPGRSKGAAAAGPPCPGPGGAGIRPHSQAASRLCARRDWVTGPALGPSSAGRGWIKEFQPLSAPAEPRIIRELQRAGGAGGVQWERHLPGGWNSGGGRNGGIRLQTGDFWPQPAIFGLGEGSRVAVGRPCVTCATGMLPGTGKAITRCGWSLGMDHPLPASLGNGMGQDDPAWLWEGCPGATAPLMMSHPPGQVP